jgi:hypothetical protein
LREIASLFDSAVVSFDQGPGSLGGAMLLGDNLSQQNHQRLADSPANIHRIMEEARGCTLIVPCGPSTLTAATNTAATRTAATRTAVTHTAPTNERDGIAPGDVARQGRRWFGAPRCIAQLETASSGAWKLRPLNSN